MLNALQGDTFPLSRTIDPTQIPDQLKQFSPASRFCLGPGAREPPSFGVIPGSTTRGHQCSIGGAAEQLPGSARRPFSPVALFCSRQHQRHASYEQLLLIGIDLNRIPLNQLPKAHIRADRGTSSRRSGRLPLICVLWGVYVISVDEDFKNPRAVPRWFLVSSARSCSELDGGRRLYIREDGLSRAQSGVESRRSGASCALSPHRDPSSPWGPGLGRLRWGRCSSGNCPSSSERQSPGRLDETHPWALGPRWGQTTSQ